MSTPVRASDQDLRTLARIVRVDRPDLPDGEGLPPSLLADLIARFAATPWRWTDGTAGGRRAGSARKSRASATPPGTRPWIRRSGQIIGTASTAVTRPAPATYAASLPSRTSTRPGNGTPPA